MTVRVEAVCGDITAQHVDAIVNAANSTLLGGGGVDGAIHAAAGPALLDECRALRRTSHRDGLPAGDAVVTTAGLMPAQWVIHTVGPRHWEHPDGGRALLHDCHRRALEEADRVGARSVAFPAISCGAYGWSPSDAAPIAVAAVREHVAQHEECAIELVRFVLSSDEIRAVFEQACSVTE